MFEIRFITHSLTDIDSVNYVLSHGRITPKRRYRYLRFKIVGLSINGAYSIASSGYMHIVFPLEIVTKYAIKPVVYHRCNNITVMLPDFSKRFYYYHYRYVFEMEVVAEEEIPLTECKAVYLSPFLPVKYRERIAARLWEWGIESRVGVPCVPETRTLVSMFLDLFSRGEYDEAYRITRAYNMFISNFFGIEYREPTEEYLIRLFWYWKAEEYNRA